MRNINRSKFPCRVCAKSVHGKNKAVQCDLCEPWIHIKCNKRNYLDYRYLQNCDESWYCIECCSTIFPFNFLSSNKNFLGCCTNTDSNIIQWKNQENDHNSSLSLKSSKPSSNLELSVNSNDPEKICSSKYYDIEEMHNIKIPHKDKSLSLFYITTCSLKKKFDNLQYLLICDKTKFETAIN